MNRHLRSSLVHGAASLCVLAALAAAGLAPALAVEVWSRSAKTFRAGTLEGMAIAPDGSLVPAPVTRELVRAPVGVLWSGALTAGRAFVGASEGGGLYEFALDDTNMQSAMELDALPDVFAVAKGAKGALYAATGPSGAIYEIRPQDNRARSIAKLDAVYIWDLAILADGSIAAATGIPGTVQRIDPKTGETRVLFETKDDHVRSLVVAPDGVLYAGTSGSGHVVRLGRDGSERFVVYDGNRPEVVALVFGDDGALYAGFAGSAANGAAAPTSPSEAAKQAVAAVSETITVRANADGDDTAKKDESGADAARGPRSPLPQGGGELVRIPATGEPVTLWSDKGETPLALAPWTGGVLMGTGAPARVWWFDAERGEGWLAVVPEARAVTLLDRDGDRLLLGTSLPAIVRVLGAGSPAKDPARYLSDVVDAKARARLGTVQAVTSAAHANAVTVFARTGNTAEPDAGWTAWKALPGAAAPPPAAGVAPGLEDARYFQIKVEMSAPAAVSRLEARYLPANRPPVVEALEAQPFGVAWRPIPPPPVASGDEPVVAPASTPDAEESIGRSRRGWRPKKVYEAGALTLTWKASDPDGDDLVYDLFSCRDDGAPCAAWSPLAEGLEREFHSFDARLLPDGVYRFRLVASDAASNALGAGARAELVSDPVAIDNAPPAIELAPAAWTREGRLEIAFAAKDPNGRIARAEIGGDATGRFVTLAPEDGLADEAEESYRVAIDAPAKGRETIVRVIDAAGNTTTARVAAPENARQR